MQGCFKSTSTKINFLFSISDFDLTQNNPNYLKGHSHSRSRTNHSQIKHRLGLCLLVRREIDQIIGVSGTEIMHESNMNCARIIYNHWQFTDILCTSTHMSKYGVVFHDHSTHAQHTNHWWSASKHARFAIVSGCQWNECDMCAVHAWYEGRASVDGRARYWTSSDAYALIRQTRVPSIVTHTWRINYARWLMNNAHRRITHTMHNPRRNKNMCVILAWFMRFCCETGPWARFSCKSDICKVSSRLTKNKRAQRALGG